MKLTEHPFILSIPESHRAELLPEVETEDFAAGDTIFPEGSESNAMYLILEGSVSFGKNREDGTRQIISHASSGEFFGEVGVFNNEPRALDAKANVASCIASIHKSTFHKIIKDAEPIKKILESIIRHLSSTTTHYMSDLMRAEKLSLVGTMMASILHDFRNPFSIISLGAHLIKTRHQEDEKTEKVCLNIDAQINRMVDMANDLSAFARGDEAINLTEIQANELIEDFRELNEPFFADPLIPITTQLDDIGLKVDVGKMHRVLQNLVNNAREAIGKDAGSIHIACRKQENAIVLEVTDSGPGIPEHIQERFFEPFVTAGKANGTGLGTAIARSNIRAHGGEIEFRTQPGETTFTINLPIER